jgi:hypothetical protein
MTPLDESIKTFKDEFNKVLAKCYDTIDTNKRLLDQFKTDKSTENLSLESFMGLLDTYSTNNALNIQELDSFCKTEIPLVVINWKKLNAEIESTKEITVKLECDNEEMAQGIKSLNAQLSESADFTRKEFQTSLSLMEERHQKQQKLMFESHTSSLESVKEQQKKELDRIKISQMSNLKQLNDTKDEECKQKLSKLESALKDEKEKEFQQLLEKQQYNLKNQFHEQSVLLEENCRKRNVQNLQMHDKFKSQLFRKKCQEEKEMLKKEFEEENRKGNLSRKVVDAFKHRATMKKVEKIENLSGQAQRMLEKTRALGLNDVKLDPATRSFLGGQKKKKTAKSKRRK